MNAYSWAEILGALVARRELTEDEMRAVVGEMMRGQCGEAEGGAFLIGLRMKGETPGEVAAAACALREHMLSWDPGCPVLDTCGTGGDGAGTFNISTAAAFVAAGAGAKVVKHGNRSASSRFGSADVLEALGVVIDCSADRAREHLDKSGLAFCFAPRFHPALKHIAPLRRRLGVPTIFNCLGPLANPAGARHQLLGVGRIQQLELMAEALARLGTGRSLLVCGHDGLDEVSLSGPTLVREVTGNEVRSWEWTPAAFGLEEVHLLDLAAANATESAAMIERVLDGQAGPAARMVMANAAAALMAAGVASTPREGVSLASDAISSGRARNVLDSLKGMFTP